MAKSNGKLLQIPKLFELRNLSGFENNCLNLEMVINTNKSITTVDFSTLWGLKKDFYEIEIPLYPSSNNNGTLNINLNISACLKFENDYLFAYSTHEVVSFEIEKKIVYYLIFFFFYSFYPSMNNKNFIVP
jgi:hypothetical protein